MRAVDNAIKNARDEAERETEVERDEAAHKEIHSGPAADRRVDLIKSVLDKVED